MGESVLSDFSLIFYPIWTAFNIETEWTFVCNTFLQTCSGCPGFMLAKIYIHICIVDLCVCACVCTFVMPVIIQLVNLFLKETVFIA